MNGQILREGEEMRKRWTEYLEQILEQAIHVVGGLRMPVFGELNKRVLSTDEIRHTSGMDGFAVKCLKKGFPAVL